MISFFFRKNRLYLHQYLCINVVYSIFFLCVFFMTRKNINISHLFYTLIYAKAVPINSYLLCTSVYIVVVFLSATSFIGAPIISLSLIYRITVILGILDIVIHIYGISRHMLTIIIFSLKSINFSSQTFYSIITVIIPQIILELLISYILSYMGTYLSLQSFKLTFIQKDNFRLKFLINYMLNYLIIVVLCIFLSCFIKIYIL